MPLVFLDIDGVLNSGLFFNSPAFADRERHPPGSADWSAAKVDPQAVALLNELLERTGRRG